MTTETIKESNCNACISTEIGDFECMRLDPLPETHGAVVNGSTCDMCGGKFNEGQHTCLVPSGVAYSDGIMNAEMMHWDCFIGYIAGLLVSLLVVHVEDLV